MAFKSLQRLQLFGYYPIRPYNDDNFFPLIFGEPEIQAAHDWEGLEKLAALQEVHIAAVVTGADSCLTVLCSLPRLTSLSIEYVTYRRV